MSFQSGIGFQPVSKNNTNTKPMTGWKPIPLLLLLTAIASAQEIDFNTQIKPLLSDRCYKCHGPDDNARVTDFRLDVEDVALGELDDGTQAIVKGDTKQSILWKRIHSDDPICSCRRRIQT